MKTKPEMTNAEVNVMQNHLGETIERFWIVYGLVLVVTDRNHKTPDPGGWATCALRTAIKDLAGELEAVSGFNVITPDKKRGADS